MFGVAHPILQRWSPFGRALEIRHSRIPSTGQELAKLPMTNRNAKGLDAAIFALVMVSASHGRTRLANVGASSAQLLERKRDGLRVVLGLGQILNRFSVLNAGRWWGCRGGLTSKENTCEQKDRASSYWFSRGRLQVAGQPPHDPPGQ